MVSGPYQSKLLRLALGQYRKGLERHRRAVRQTKASVVTGAVVGGAWALAPIQGVMRISDGISGRLTGRFKQRLKRFAKVDWIGQLIPSGLEDGLAVGRLEEEAIAQLFSSVSDCLSAQQIAELPVANWPMPFLGQLPEPLPSQISEQPPGRVAPGKSSLSLFPFLARVLRTVPSTGWLSGLGHLLGRLSKHRSHHVTEQITGVASDLENRHLVLVLNLTVVWDGLSDVQQQLIGSKIEALVGEAGAMPAIEDDHYGVVGVSRSVLSAVAGIATVPTAHSTHGVRSVSGIDGLAQSVRSFWVDVLWAVVRLRQRRQRLLSPGDSVLTGQKRVWQGLLDFFRQGSVLIRFFQASSVYKRVREQALFEGWRWGEWSLPPTKQNLRLNPAGCDNTGSIEAEVISVRYVEHPLERVLNWVDKALFWLERQWQYLMDWLKGLSSKA